MAQRNDEEGGKQPRFFFSPAATVRGHMGSAWTTGGRNAPRTTESITEKDYVAFVHQFFGLTNNPALAPFANVPCPCQRKFMGGEGAWDHINSCLHHASNRTCANDHVLRALERICNDAGFATTICWWTSPCATIFGAGHIWQNQGQLGNPDNPDHILESAAADKIRNYRDTYRSNRHEAFLSACMSTSGRIHGEFLRLIFFLSKKQADDFFAALGYQPHKQEFCHRRGVFFQQNQGTIVMACAQVVALRGAPTTARRHVAAPRCPPPLHMAYDDHDQNVSHIHGFA